MVASKFLFENVNQLYRKTGGGHPGRQELLLQRSPLWLPSPCLAIHWIDVCI
jgi:hypothetical protein